ncbi:alpha/beta hydrolase [Colwellia psychrerythraea]|uniref:Putative lipase n=1 Tax=Colwellia psychrerythraea (strain 34H / ATCC BAA-681) TaxID=167879 RepID=Q487S5_COLP3|nr:alpha/beta hydrolase [Colwellia psychrerythraea]AAZ28637.1 putative lipase [Colwellia psychrerythraea 34H]
MRGIISPKLVPLLEQANIAIAAAKATGQGFSAELVRQGLDNLSALMGAGPNIAIVKDSFLATSSHNIPVRIYNPAPNDMLPVLLHFHGGGHMCGSADLYDPISRKLALATQAIVICVDYRLAPEYPYPAGLDDCQQVLERYQSLLTEMKYSDELYIAGDSAGGAICTSLVMNNLINEKTSNSIKIDKQILVYPSVDYTMASASIDENGQGFLLEKDKMHWYFQQYFQVSSLEQDEITQAKIVKASPLLGKFSANMPTTLVITAGCDPLRDEGVAYAKSLDEVGVNVEHHSFDGMTHAYMLLNDLVSDECQQTYQLIGQFVKAGINDQ